jgi:hypothetical protein
MMPVLRPQPAMTEKQSESSWAHAEIVLICLDRFVPPGQFTVLTEFLEVGVKIQLIASY